MLQVQNNSSLLFGLIYSFVLNWKLALGLVAATPAIMIAGGMQMKVFMGAQKETEEAHEKIGHVLTETVSAVRTSTNIYIIFSVWREICTLRNEKLHTEA